MAETLIEKATCEKCGSDVRENTLFCYNCGTRVVEDDGSDNEAIPKPDGEDQAPDLATQFNIEEPSEDKLAKAAEERRRARVERRKPKEYVWAPVEPVSGAILLMVSLLVAVLVGLLVIVFFWWK